MYSVQCHFCSMSNPADAKFCSGCMVQLNLAPCPHCDEVNELSALVCHACKGELLQAVVERASGDSEQAGTFPVRIGIDTPAPVATRSVVGGGLFGSRRETYGTEAADSGQAERSKLPAQHARIGLGQHKSLSAKQAMVPLRRALGVRTRIPVSFSRLRVVAAVVGVGVVLAIGVLVYAPSRAPLMSRRLLSPLRPVTRRHPSRRHSYLRFHTAGAGLCRPWHRSRSNPHRPNVSRPPLLWR